MFGNVSERKLMEKINTIKSNSTKKLSDIKDDFAQMQKTKADALKKTEKLMQYTNSNLAKIESVVIKSKDLAPESVARLKTEIEATTNSTIKTYDLLKNQITSAVLPDIKALTPSSELPSASFDKVLTPVSDVSSASESGIQDVKPSSEESKPES